MNFKVIDKQTGKEANPYEIALHEEWACGLVYCDMEGFAITEDGYLVLMDECGHVVYCDADRFKVVLEDERPHGEWNVRHDTMYHFECPFCKYLHQYKDNFCPLCGADMREGEVK